MFEYFLAKVFGGEATGARGDAVDFEIGDGEEKTLGSAKLVSAKAGASAQYIPQAESGFDRHIGQTIIYLIGVKNPSLERVSTGAVAPLEIESVDIYKLKVVYQGNEKEIEVNGINRKDIWKKYAKSENPVGYFDFGKVISKDNLKPLGTLQIMTTTEEGIKGFRQRARQETVGTTKQLLKYIEMLFISLREADEKSRSYASSGKRDDGVKSLTALNSASLRIKQLSQISKDDYATLPDDT